MRSLITLVLLAPCIALACTSPPSAAPLPDWADDPYAHPECHQAYQLCDVGISPGVGSDAREQARLRALEHMVAQIQVQVASEIEITSSTRIEDGDAFWNESLNEQIRLTASGELPGATVIERWQDSVAGETYVLVAVDREHLLDLLLPPVEQAHVSASGLLSATPEGGDDPAREFLNAAQAFRLVSESMGDATRAKVVAAHTPFAARTQTSFEHSASLLARASDRLASLSGAMRVETLSGDDQLGSPRGSLAEALVARFSILDEEGHERPVADLPVRFESEAGHGPALAAPASTDAQGQIRCLVTDLQPTGRSANRILARPDVEALSLPGGVLPHAAFIYRLPTPAQTVISVDIASSFDGKPLSVDNMAATVAGHLSEHGFDAGTAQGLIGLSVAELRGRLGSRTHYVLRGTASSWFSSQEGPLFFFKGQAKLELVELSTARVQSITTQPELAGHSSKSEQGGVKALRAVKRPLLELLDIEFVSLFVPSDRGQG